MSQIRTLDGPPVAARPEEATYRMVEEPMPDPGRGQALTRTIYVSLDPY